MIRITTLTRKYYICWIFIPRLYWFLKIIIHPWFKGWSNKTFEFQMWPTSQQKLLKFKCQKPTSKGTMSNLNKSKTKNGPKDFKMHILGSKLQNLKYFLHIVVSGLKVIIGFRHPVTIGIYISTEISKTSHPRHQQIWPLVRNT